MNSIETFSQYWCKLLEQANQNELTHFSFIYKNEIYECIWSKNKWNEPRKIGNFLFNESELPVDDRIKHKLIDYQDQPFKTLFKLLKITNTSIGEYLYEQSPSNLGFLALIQEFNKFLIPHIES